jgi:hypothetical protein
MRFDAKARIISGRCQSGVLSGFRQVFALTASSFTGTLAARRHHHHPEAGGWRIIHRQADSQLVKQGA